MELKEFLHMKQGDGERGYAQNTVIQTAAVDRTRSIIEKAVNSLASDKIIKPSGDQVLNVADLGCGVGPVSLAFTSTIVGNVQRKCKELNWDDDQVPQMQIYLNDLPSNDFSLLFRDLAKLQLQEQKRRIPPSYFVMGVPGSFYGHLFPRNSLHFVHSNYALHWLSQVPPGLTNKQGSPINRRNIHVSETSPPAVAKAYLAQFQEDWTLLLKCRSNELVSNGRAIFIVRGSSSICFQQPALELYLLGQAITSLVSQELIKEDEVDTFDFPTYCPSEDEIRKVVQREGSFEIEHMETVVDHIGKEIEDTYIRAEAFAKCIRGFTETVVSYHFGGDILDALYNELNQVSFDYLTKKPFEVSTILVLLRKKPKVILYQCPS